MAIIKKGKMSNIGEGAEKVEPSRIADGKVNGADSVEQSGGS